jgi:hypothetical protein
MLHAIKAVHFLAFEKAEKSDISVAGAGSMHATV